MQTLTTISPSGDVSKLYLSKGTTYSANTPKKVISVLNALIHDKDNIIRVFFGDHATGRDWCEENDVVGYVGRSSGSQKIPLLLEPLLNNYGSLMSSNGGGSLLDASIVRIINVTTGVELYRTERYEIPLFQVLDEPDPALREEGYVTRVDREGKNWARFKTQDEAAEYVAFLQGYRVARPYRTKAECDREDAEFQKSLTDAD
jgi:hypothetical protein